MAVPTLASFSLADRTTIVTGGGSGLGAVMAEAIVRSGSSLAIVDINKAGAEAEATRIRVIATEVFGEKAPKVTVHIVDVSDETQVIAAVEEVVAQHGKVDGLVTAAGFVENFKAEEYPIDRIRKLWAVNVDGSYLFATAVARECFRRGTRGSIVFIGSMSGSIVNVPQFQTPYNMSKAAVRHMAASLAVEWAQRGMRVNCISPGYMATPLTKTILTAKPELGAEWISRTPAGRLGEPDDLTGPVTFLLSDSARFVTGEELKVDGAYCCT